MGHHVHHIEYRASIANITLNLFDDNGNPLSLPVTFPQTSATAVTDSTFTGPLNAGEVLLIQTAGLNNPLVSGWAQLLSDGDVSGFAVFTDNVTASQQQQAVVPLQSLNPSAYQLWFDNTNGFATAVALANESMQPATISLLVRDDTGNPITTQSIQLPGLGHTSFVLATNYPITANLRGTVEFSEPARWAGERPGAQFQSGVGLHFDSRRRAVSADVMLEIRDARNPESVALAGAAGGSLGILPPHPLLWPLRHPVGLSQLSSFTSLVHRPLVCPR